MTRAHAGWVIYASLVGALLFTLLPLPMDWRGLRPDLAALALFYWVLALPHRVGVATAFTVGVAQDLIEGAPLGLSSPGLMLATLLLLYNYQRIRQFDQISRCICGLESSILQNPDNDMSNTNRTEDPVVTTTPRLGNCGGKIGKQEPSRLHPFCAIP